MWESVFMNWRWDKGFGCRWRSIEIETPFLMNFFRDVNWIKGDILHSYILRGAPVVASMGGKGSCEIMRRERESAYCRASRLFYSLKNLFFKNLFITAIDFIFSTCHTSMTWNRVNRGNLNGAKMDSSCQGKKGRERLKKEFKKID